MSPAELALVPEPPVAGVLLTPAEVSRRLSVSRSLVYLLIKKGDLRALYVGRLPRVREEDLAAYLATAADRRRS